MKSPIPSGIVCVGLPSLLAAFGLAVAPAHAARYKIRPLGIVGGRTGGSGFLQDYDPLELMLDIPSGALDPGRCRMSMNGLGQVVEDIGVNGTSLLWLPAPAFGMSAGYHYFPAGFEAQRISAAGHVVGIIPADYTAAIWYNGNLTDLGKMGLDYVVNVDVTYRGVVVGTAIKTNPVAFASPHFLGTAFIAAPGSTNLQPMFPGDANPNWAFRVNNNADVVGGETPALVQGNVTGTPFVTHNGDSLQPGPMEYVSDPVLPDVYGEVINAFGDIAGVQHIPPGSSQGDQMFAYASSGQTDLPTAPDLLPTTNTMNTYADAYAVNTRGQILCAVGSGEFVYLYQGGTFTKLENLIPAGSGWTSLAGADLNDNGWIVGAGTYNGQIDQAFLMIPVGLDAKLAATPDRVFVGAPVTVTLTLSNETAAADSAVTLTNVGPNFNPSVDGNGGLIYTNGPTPASVASLGPGATATFTYTYRATARGTNLLYAIGHGLDPSAASPYGRFLPSDYATTRVDIGGIEASLSATPQRVRTNDLIYVTLTARNTANSPGPISQIAPTGPLTVEGTGDAQLVQGPDITNAVTLNPGDSTNFNYVFKAAREGHIDFKGRVAGQAPGGSPLQSDELVSDSVLIAPLGDLLIKRDTESDSQYGSESVYQTVPIGQQVRTNTIGPGDVSKFEVEMENHESTPRVFRLNAVETTNAGWNLKYFSDGQDISDAVRAGAEFPPLDSNEVYIVTIEMNGTNAAPNSAASVELFLSSPQLPFETLDAVKAATEKVFEIVVNSTGDLPDKDTNDCCCDTGRVLTNGEVECTLRAAIQFANNHPGKDIIKFKIPATDPNLDHGVPDIQPRTALPAVTDPVIIDGWSQSINSATPPIEINGETLSLNSHPVWRQPGIPAGNANYADFLLDLPGADSGLVINASDCEVRGLDINSFLLCGIELHGPNNSIQGDFFGTDPTGTIPKGNGAAGDAGLVLGIKQYLTAYIQGADVAILSANNQIGGPGRARNVFVGSGGLWAQPGWSSSSSVQRVDSWPKPPPGGDAAQSAPGILIQGANATGNRVEGNLFGLDPSGTKAVAPSIMSGEPIMPSGGVVINRASGNIVGGDTAAAANFFVRQGAGVVILEPESTNNEFIGNVCGLNTAYEGADSSLLRSDAGAILLSAGRNYIGGLGPGEGNLMVESPIVAGGADSVIAGNRIDPDGRATDDTGIWLPYDSVRVLVVSNFVRNCTGQGIRVEGTSCLVESNVITWCGVGYRDDAPEGGIVINNPGNTNSIVGNDISRCGVGVRLWETSHNVISGNSIHDNAGAGVRLSMTLSSPPSLYNRITQNTIYQDGGLGISFGDGVKPTLNDYGDLDSGPNTLLNYPELRSATPVLGVSVDGFLSMALFSKTYQVEFFASSTAPHGRGEGQRYLGSQDVTTDLSGEGPFSFEAAGNVESGEFVSATATDPDGNTSEFSKAIQACVGPDADFDGICDDLESKVPNRGGGIVQKNSPHPLGGGPGNGDGNGDGIADASQTNVCSFIGIAGKWITLAVPNGMTLLGVGPSGPPDFSGLPSDYTFPVGFINVNVMGLTAGGTVTVTNIFHDALQFSTVFAYGPTPDNTTPHWYELPATVGGDELLLTFTDAAAGDHDLTANGAINTVYAPAYRIPPGPPLSVLRKSVQTIESPSYQISTNGDVSLVTNTVPLVSLVFAWPASGTNYVLESTDILSPTNIWQPVTDGAIIVGDQIVITNVFTSATRFFRLVYFPGLAQVTSVSPSAPQLSIQLTSDKAFLLSWPTSTGNFGLQQSTALLPATWVNVTNMAFLVNGREQVVVPSATGNRFYRLVSQ